MNKQELLKAITNDDLKLAVAESTDNKFFNALSNALGRTEMKVAELNEVGLFYKNKDIYIYLGRGGIKVEETPKGVRKMLLYLSEKYNRRVVISDGVLYNGDKVDIKTDGLIDSISIERDSKTMIAGGSILAPYAVISILNKKDKVVAKKFIVMPANEYGNALKQAGMVKNTYPTMMSTKMVMKRALTQVYSLLGSGIESSDSDLLDGAIDNQNIYNQETEQKKAEYIDEEKIKWIEEEIKGLDKEAFYEFLKRNRVESISEIPVSFFFDVEQAIKSTKDNNNAE